MSCGSSQLFCALHAIEYAAALGKLRRAAHHGVTRVYGGFGRSMGLAARNLHDSSEDRGVMIWGACRPRWDLGVMCSACIRIEEVKTHLGLSRRPSNLPRGTADSMDPSGRDFQ